MILVLCSGSDPRQARFISPHGSQGDLAVTYIHGGLPTHTRGTTVLKGHIERVMSSVYRSEYQQIISSAHDGMIHVWAPPSTPLRDDEEEKRGGGGYVQRRQQNTAVLSVTDRQALLYPSIGNDTNEGHNSTPFVPPILLRNHITDAPSSSSAAVQPYATTTTTSSSYEPSYMTPATSSSSNGRTSGGFGAFSASIMPAYTDSYSNIYSSGNGRGSGRGVGRCHKRPRISGG